MLGAVGFQSDLLLGKDLGALLHAQHCLLSGISMLMKGDDRGEPRIGQRPRGNLYIGEFDVLRSLFLAKSDSVDGDSLAANLRDGFEIDATGVVGAIARQNHRSNGQAGGIRNHLFQTVAQVGGGSGGGKLFQIVEPLQMVAQPVKTNLKFLTQGIEHAGVEDILNGLTSTRSASFVGSRHAG